MCGKQDGSDRPLESEAWPQLSQHFCKLRGDAGAEERDKFPDISEIPFLEKPQSCSISNRTAESAELCDKQSSEHIAR